MSAFSVPVQVRFGHCDPAGIVYYPRYFEMINGVVEDWFARGVGVSMPALLYERRLLIPTVSFEVDFPAPSRYGDVLNYELRVLRLGHASCTLGIHANCGGELRLSVRQVIVFVSAETRKAVAIPEDLRASLAAME